MEQIQVIKHEWHSGRGVTRASLQEDQANIGFDLRQKCDNAQR